MCAHACTQTQWTKEFPEINPKDWLVLGIIDDLHRIENLNLAVNCCFVFMSHNCLEH